MDFRWSFYGSRGNSWPVTVAKEEKNTLSVKINIYIFTPPHPQKKSFSREVSPSAQKTLENSQFTLENKSDNSSNPSSPEFPATKNRWRRFFSWLWFAYAHIGWSFDASNGGNCISVLCTLKKICTRVLEQWRQKHCVCVVWRCVAGHHQSRRRRTFPGRPPTPAASPVSLRKMRERRITTQDRWVDTCKSPNHNCVQAHVTVFAWFHSCTPAVVIYVAMTVRCHFHSQSSFVDVVFYLRESVFIISTNVFAAFYKCNKLFHGLLDWHYF